RRPLAAWNDDGVAAERLPDPMSPEPVGLLLLEGTGDGDAAQDLYVVFPNFYVITRYNRSVNYAMAVYELSRAIYQRRQSMLAGVAE
ncbi:MAG TPA: lytic murein transglycosylase, partial [Burkholderiales bacterium]|nr:lytic murein transglycosylase [Burkholderiales bacterium]